MKSIIYFTIFNMIAYISSKSTTQYTPQDIQACQIKLIDDDSGAAQKNVLGNGSIAIPLLSDDLRNDVQDIYLQNRVTNALYPGYKCRYEVKACKEEDFKNCVTFTGTVTTHSARGTTYGMKMTWPKYESYFSNMKSITGTTKMERPGITPKTIDACQIKLIDDDVKSEQQNKVANGSIEIPQLSSDLLDDVQDIYLSNRLTNKLYPGYKCRYEVKACKGVKYTGGCATFTGTVTTNSALGRTYGMKMTHPTFAPYFSNMKSIKGTSVVEAPKVVTPVVTNTTPVNPSTIGTQETPKIGDSKIPRPAQIELPDMDVDDDLERRTNSKRKMRKSKKIKSLNLSLNC